MNPLQEHPHLFANGKFKVSIEYYTKIEGDIWPLTGTVDGILFLEKYNGCKLENCQLDPKGCTLIARPISDLTDKETYSLPIIERIFNGVTEANSPSQIQYYLINKANSGTLLFEDAKALLGLGVLPFPQTLFDDGTVIDSRTI